MNLQLLKEEYLLSKYTIVCEKRCFILSYTSIT